MGRWMAAAGPLPRPTATVRSGGVGTGAVTVRSCHRRRSSRRSALAASCRYSRHLPSHAGVLCRRARTPPRCPRSRPAAVLHAPTGSSRSRSRTDGLRLPGPRPHAPWRLQRSPPSVRRARQRSAHRTPAWDVARTRRPSTARRCTGTPQTAQNTTASHQKRTLVGGWPINTALPPGGVARPRYDTEMAVSTWPSICT